jgi:hypothetical protein
MIIDGDKRDEIVVCCSLGASWCRSIWARRDHAILVALPFVARCIARWRRGERPKFDINVTTIFNSDYANDSVPGKDLSYVEALGQTD